MNAAKYKYTDKDSSTGTNLSTDKYLTFFLGKEEYGIEVLKVIEIISLIDITEIPHAPSFMMGVINLRGRLIPVMDLRLRLGIDKVGYTSETCIIVTYDISMDYLIGIIVDRISEVIEIDRNEIHKTTGLSEIDASYILGLCNVEYEPKILLDIDAVLSDNKWKHNFDLQ